MMDKSSNCEPSLKHLLLKAASGARKRHAAAPLEPRRRRRPQPDQTADRAQLRPASRLRSEPCVELQTQSVVVPAFSVVPTSRRQPCELLLHRANADEPRLLQFCESLPAQLLSAPLLRPSLPPLCLCR